LIVYKIGCNCLIIMAIITLSKVIKHLYNGLFYDMLWRSCNA
jgi:hypothetical protein